MDEKERDKLLVQQIPTDREPLFRFPVDWRLVDMHGVINEKLKPWIIKKIKEYLGQEEKVAHRDYSPVICLESLRA